MASKCSSCVHRDGQTVSEVSQRCHECEKSGDLALYEPAAYESYRVRVELSRVYYIGEENEDAAWEQAVQMFYEDVSDLIIKNAEPFDEIVEVDVQEGDVALDETGRGYAEFMDEYGPADWRE